jgi:hypothetical protein
LIRSVLLSLALAAAFCGAATAEPLKVRWGYGSAPGSMAPIIFEQSNLLKHYGGAAPQMTAFAGGEVDLANFAYANLGMAAIDARIEDARK